MNVLQRAALQHWGLVDAPIEAQVARVRARHWLPHVSLRGFYNDTASLPYSDLSTAGTWRSGVGGDVRLIFQLPELVYDEHEATLRRDALLLQREQRELGRTILTLSQKLAALRDELRGADASLGDVFADTLSTWLELDMVSGGACREWLREKS